MKFEVYYLILPTSRLLEIAGRGDSAYASLLTEKTLLRAEEGNPRYPLDGFDHTLYVKSLFVLGLATEYGGDPEYRSYWPGDPPTTAKDFDVYWTVEIVSCENVAGLESQVAGKRNDAADVDTGNPAVDEALRELLGSA